MTNVTSLQLVPNMAAITNVDEFFFELEKLANQNGLPFKRDATVEEPNLSDMETVMAAGMLINDSCHVGDLSVAVAQGDRFTIDVFAFSEDEDDSAPANELDDDGNMLDVEIVQQIEDAGLQFQSFEGAYAYVAYAINKGLFDSQLDDAPGLGIDPQVSYMVVENTPDGLGRLYARIHPLDMHALSSQLAVLNEMSAIGMPDKSIINGETVVLSWAFDRYMLEGGLYNMLEIWQERGWSHEAPSVVLPL